MKAYITRFGGLAVLLGTPFLDQTSAFVASPLSAPRRWVPVAPLEAATSSSEIEILTTEVVDRPFKITDMLLQRSIQTQLHYYTQLRNEPVSNWLSNFENHGHLDRGMKWHSCMGMRLGLQDYLEQMVTAEDVSIMVKYGIDVGFTMAPHLEKEDLEDHKLSGHRLPDELNTWAHSAASRRRNPYLQDRHLGQGQREYEETVQPRMLARSLSGLVQTLCSEWTADLDYIAKQAVTDHELKKGERERIAEHEKRRIDDSDMLLQQTRGNLPSRAALIRVNRLQSQKSLEGGYDMKAYLGLWKTRNSAFGDDDTPLRRLNFELIERAVMFEAGRLFIEQLQKRGWSDELLYMRRFLDEWEPRLMGQGFEGVDAAMGLSLPLAVQQTPVAAVMFEALNLRPPTKGSSGSLIDPTSLAKLLLAYRREAASKLAAQLEDVDGMLVEVQKKGLDAQFSSSPLAN